MPSIGVTRWHPFNFAYIGLSSNRVSIKYWVIVEPGFNQTNAMVLPEKWLPCFYKGFLCDDHLDEHVPLIVFFQFIGPPKEKPFQCLFRISMAQLARCLFKMLSQFF